MNGDGQNLYQKNQKRINDITNFEISKLIKKLDDQINLFREGKLLPDEVMKNIREASVKHSELEGSVARILRMDIPAITDFWKDKHIVDFNEEKWPSFKPESLKAYIDFCEEKRGFIDGLDESDQRELKQKNLQYETTFRLYDNLRLYKEREEEFLKEIQDRRESPDIKNPEPPPRNLPGGVKKPPQPPQLPEAKPAPSMPEWRRHLIDKGFLYPDGKRVVNSLDEVARELVRFNKRITSSKFLQENFLMSDEKPYSKRACDKARTYANKDVNN